MTQEQLNKLAKTKRLAAHDTYLRKQALKLFYLEERMNSC